MTKKKSGKSDDFPNVKGCHTNPEPAKVKVYDPPVPGTVIKDFGNYRVVVTHSTVEEMKGRVVYAVINNVYGVIEEECSVLPQALLHATQFNKEMTNDHWQERLKPTGMMVPTGAQMVQPGPQGRGH